MELENETDSASLPIHPAQNRRTVSLSSALAKEDQDARPSKESFHPVVEPSTESEVLQRRQHSPYLAVSRKHLEFLFPLEQPPSEIDLRASEHSQTDVETQVAELLQEKPLPLHLQEQVVSQPV